MFLVILLIAVWWQMMMKILIKYQTNQTSIALKPLVFGKSLLFVNDPNNVTSTSKAVTDVLFLFVRSSTSYWRVKNASNQRTTLGVIIWIIPFTGRLFNTTTMINPMSDDPFVWKCWDESMYGERATSNSPTVLPPVYVIDSFVTTRSTLLWGAN